MTLTGQADRLPLQTPPSRGPTHRANRSGRCLLRHFPGGFCTTTTAAFLFDQLSATRANYDAAHVDKSGASVVVRFPDSALGAALLPVPGDEATWRIPLGVASRSDLDVARVSVGDLRPLRGAIAPQLAPRLAGRRLVLLPEDDVPHIRGVIERLAVGAGLRPDQLAVAHTRHGALAAVLAGDDLLRRRRAG